MSVRDHLLLSGPRGAQVPKPRAPLGHVKILFAPPFSGTRRDDRAHLTLSAFWTRPLHEAPIISCFREKPKSTPFLPHLSRDLCISTERPDHISTSPTNNKIPTEGERERLLLGMKKERHGRACRSLSRSPLKPRPSQGGTRRMNGRGEMGTRSAVRRGRDAPMAPRGAHRIQMGCAHIDRGPNIHSGERKIESGPFESLR